jgi:two-component sensor histidine kinase
MLQTRGLGVWSRYGLATLLVLLSLVAALTPLLKSYPYLAFFPVVVLCGFFLGRGSGVYATLLSAALVAYCLLPPHFALAVAHPEDFVGLLVFIAAGVLTVILAESLYAAYADVAASDQQLRATAEQRATLLQELAHRVRNDLASLAALLAMRSRTEQHEGARSALADASQRIQLLGRIYQRLSVDHGKAVVDTRAFITDLCDSLRVTSAGLRPIVLNVSVESHPLAIKQAVPLGLIVNELVTNALKHAFELNQRGEIKVQFSRQGGEFLLSVRDDGRGPPAAQQDTGFGLSLAGALAAQLGGQLERQDAQPGSLYVVTVPAGQL